MRPGCRLPDSSSVGVGVGIGIVPGGRNSPLPRRFRTHNCSTSCCRCNTKLSRPGFGSGFARVCNRRGFVGGTGEPVPGFRPRIPCRTRCSMVSIPVPTPTQTQTPIARQYECRDQPHAHPGSGTEPEVGSRIPPASESESESTPCPHPTNRRIAKGQLLSTPFSRPSTRKRLLKSKTHRWTPT